MRRTYAGIWPAVFKPLTDRVAAAAGLIVLSPLFGIIFVLARVLLGKPALFRQLRTGYHGRLFELVKFRSMSDARDDHGRLLPDAERLTRFGAFLRASSLDELPQLWNVLRGDMSLVGPRPLLPEYLPRYSATQLRRHDVKPGVTGLAQVSGRNAISWEKKFELDVEYVSNVTMRGDLVILWRTVLKVIGRNDVSRDGYATVPEFRGSGTEGGERLG
jgi:lipopolysaccharide/colanic/teichoic acid biosynthesis glycosyltransferase